MSSPSSERTGSGVLDALVPVPLPRAHDEGVFGGKAVQLGIAARAGLPVPAGFALPGPLVAAVAAGDERATEPVRQACSALGDGPVAVRSSAVGEDGDAASFAGQHATVLNAPDVLEAVTRVARSAGDRGALAYRARLGRPRSGAVGVVLQQLVPADVAGVLFTCNPVTGADEVVIEASWSLGEAVVEGLVCPDFYRLSWDGTLREVRVGCKDAEVVPRAGGGTEVVPVPADRAVRPCLDDARLAALVDLAARARRVWPAASDLEWAMACGRLSLLQRRPVTSLPSAPGSCAPGD